jgi:hypothetical protein
MKAGAFALPAAALLALGVAFSTTSGHPWIPPSYGFLGAGSVLLAGCLLIPERFSRPAAIVGALVAGLTAGHVVGVVSGMPRVHDLMHLWGIWAYGRCVGEGFFYPRWIPYLGAGLPLFEFYGPVNFLLTLPGILAGLSPVGAWKTELLLAHALCSVSMAAAARLLGVRWRSALVAGAAMAFAPWRLAVFDYRGALGEANAFLFLPLVAAGAIRTWTKPGRLPAAVLAVAATGLVLTHVTSLFTLLVTLAPVLLVFEIVSAPEEAKRTHRLGALARSGLAVAGLTCAFWLPIAFESRFTSLDETTKANPFYLYSEQGVRPMALVERRAWDSLRVSLPESVRRERGLEGEEMPFYTGAALVFLGVASALGSRRRETGALVAAALLALGLSISPMAHLLGSVPGFDAVRFPWRFLSPASVLAALALGLGCDAWIGDARAKGWRLFFPLLLVGSLVVDAIPYTGAADRIPPYTGITHWYGSDPKWTHWETSMTPAPVELPARTGVVRVRNLELPPSTYEGGIDSFFPGYYEWLTPAIYREYWRSTDPGALAAAGVRWGFSNSRRDPIPFPARPYATLEPPAGSTSAIGEGEVRREPGRISVAAIVPRGGARLVVLEQRFPGWTARVDGAPRAPLDDTAFLALDLPEGKHGVVFTYGGTWPRRAGVVATLLTLALALGTLSKPRLWGQLHAASRSKLSPKPPFGRRPRARIRE